MSQGRVESKMCNGNVLPYSFVKIDTTSPFRVIQAAANSDILYGISSEAVKNPPIPQDTSTQYAGVAGDEIRVYCVGAECLIKLGTGGCTAGDRLTSDGSGSGITATSGQIAGAIALDTGIAGDLRRVRVIDPMKI
jgi:hypothetical protein